MSAVSIMLKPASTKASRMANDVGSSAVQPNTLPPRTSGAVSSPLLPSLRFCMSISPFPIRCRPAPGGSARRPRSGSAQAGRRLRQPQPHVLGAGVALLRPLDAPVRAEDERLAVALDRLAGAVNQHAAVRALYVFLDVVAVLGKAHLFSPLQPAVVSARG